MLSSSTPPGPMPWKLSVRTRRDTCAPMFTVALFRQLRRAHVRRGIIPTAQTQEQPRCPRAGERVGERWYMLTMEHILP